MFSGTSDPSTGTGGQHPGLLFSLFFLSSEPQSILPSPLFSSCCFPSEHLSLHQSSLLPSKSPSCRSRAFSVPPSFCTAHFLFYHFNAWLVDLLLVFSFTLAKLLFFSFFSKTFLSSRPLSLTQIPPTSLLLHLSLSFSLSLCLSIHPPSHRLRWE